VLQSTGRAIAVGVLIVSQELPIFLATPWAGWLADRLDRRKLMIACDLARTALCVGFLAVGPDNLWLGFVLIAVLSTFAAVFDPASTAATPNVVDPEDLSIANAMNGSLWGTMLAVGAALGGIISAAFGRDTAFLVDAVSFAVSAALLAGIRRPFSEERHDEEHEGILSATVETARYARRDHRVLALLSVKFGFGMAAGVLALVAVFGREVFHGGDVGFGLLMSGRGVGALIGPFLGHRLSGRDHERILPAIAGALAVFGLGYVLLGLAPSLWFATGAILLAHVGGGGQWMLSTYGLQRLVPDRIRGRIFAFDFALITLSLAVSSIIASSLADAIGPRPAVMIVGGIAFAWSIAWWVLTRGVRKTPIFEGCGDAPEGERTMFTMAVD
jgi:MFS family permease